MQHYSTSFRGAEKMQNLSLLILIVVQCNAVISYKILGVFPTTSPSHYYVGRALMKGLAADGHDVTIISHFKEKNPFPNYNEVYLDGSYHEVLNVTNAGNFFKYNNQYIWNLMPKVYEFGLLSTNSTLNHPRFREFLQSGVEFDVIVLSIFLSEPLLVLGHHFDAPVIAISSFGASKWTTDLVGSPNIASYVPHTYMGTSDRMTFAERVRNLFYYWYEDIAIPINIIPHQQELLDKYFPGKNVPTIEQLKRNVSLVLLSTHVTLGIPRPYAPNMIEVGGMHIERDVKALPANLQKFLDEAKDGAIFFSLGTNVRFSTMPVEKRSAMLRAFKEYPKMRLLMKLDVDAIVPTHSPSDVLIQSWLPQQSILAHPNVKLFVTHGGLLSTMESIYFGKPVVGIPIFADQHFNMKMATLKCYGESLPYEDFSETTFKETLRKVLSDPSYAENAKTTSDRYRDQIASPLETAIHWVKHVAKNKGAPHLRSAAVDMPIYIYYNLDVYAVAIGIISLILLSVRRIFQIIVNFTVNRPTNTKISKKKTI